MTWEYYQLFTYVWMALGLFTFIYLFRVIAPFGRHTRSGWGPMVDNRIGWVVMEATVLVVAGLILADSPKPFTAPVVVMLGLFAAHYIHRSLIFPLFLRTRGKKMPIAIMASAMGFNLVNGFLIGYYFGHFADYSPAWFSDDRFKIGLLLFGIGAAINISTDYQLIRLRKPGAENYSIPTGGLFRYISCPNHLGEILEWTGFAVLTWSLPGAAFAWWTFANLAPRAVAHHRWYREHFEDYPKVRKAWVPFVW